MRLQVIMIAENAGTIARDARLKLGMTAADLAAHVRLSLQKLRQFEAGKAELNLTYLMRLHDALKMWPGAGGLFSISVELATLLDDLGNTDTAHIDSKQEEPTKNAQNKSGAESYHRGSQDAPQDREDMAENRMANEDKGDERVAKHPHDGMEDAPHSHAFTGDKLCNPVNQTIKTQSEDAGEEHPQYAIPTSTGQPITLSIPAGISKSDIQRIKDWLGIMTIVLCKTEPRKC